MAQRNSPTIDIDLVFIQPKLSYHRNGLRCKRLVYLKEIDIVICE